jgi:hypothetical protein
VEDWNRSLLCTALGALILVCLGPTTVAGGSEGNALVDRKLSPLDAAVFAPEIDQNQCVWWIHYGGPITAVANFGPILQSQSGYWYRRWILMIHVPDTGEPITCIQGIFNIDDLSPIWAKGESFYVHLRPIPGLAWGQVLQSSDIIATVGDSEAGEQRVDELE